MQKHDRAAAFGGSDGRAYSVAVYVDEEPDVRGLFGASLLFVRWSPGGDRPIGHVETEPLAWGHTPEEATERIEALSLYDVKAALDEAIARAPGGVVSGAPRHGAGAGRLGLSGGHRRRRGPRRPPRQGQARHAQGRGGRSGPDGARARRRAARASSASSPAARVLERRVPEGRGARPIAANVDQVFVVIATADPAPIPQLIDRLLVVAEANGIAAAVVRRTRWTSTPGRADRRALPPGRLPGAIPPVWRPARGSQSLEAALTGRTSVVTGPSGAGKSSLLNAVQPGLQLRTGEISAKVRRGRNTTVVGGDAAARPAAGTWWTRRDSARWGSGGWTRGRWTTASPTSVPSSATAATRDCRHRSEPGCRVREAMEDGGIAPDRWESYLVAAGRIGSAPRDWE